MTLDVYRGRKTTMQQQQHMHGVFKLACMKVQGIIVRCTDLGMDVGITLKHFCTQNGLNSVEKQGKLSLNYLCYPLFSGTLGTLRYQELTM